MQKTNTTILSDIINTLEKQIAQLEGIYYNYGKSGRTKYEDYCKLEEVLKGLRAVDNTLKELTNN